MAERHSPKLYSVEEARALLPWLRAILTALRADKRQLDAEMRQLGSLTPAMRSNGQAVEAERLERRVAELTTAIREKLEQIDALDIEVKDIDAGLVDFYSERDGRIVYLCWRADEPTISFWHDLDAGFRGRRPLGGS